jgi:hypothetical protein
VPLYLLRFRLYSFLLGYVHQIDNLSYSEDWQIEQTKVKKKKAKKNKDGKDYISVNTTDPNEAEYVIN